MEVASVVGARSSESGLAVEGNCVAACLRLGDLETMELDER